MKHIFLTVLLSVAFFLNATASGALDRAGWTATTSATWNPGAHGLPNLFDNDLGTHWSSTSVLKAGEWMIIDMKSKQAFNQIVMDQTVNNGDCPNGFAVYVSDDGQNWGESVAAGAGTSGPQTSITFSEKVGRYIKIEMTEDRGAYWAMSELYVNLADTRATWTATSSLTNAHNEGTLQNMFDGSLDTQWSSTAELTNGDWMIIDMKLERIFNQIILNQTKATGDCPDDFSIYVSKDGTNWGEKIASGRGTNGAQTEILFMEQTAQYIKIELGQRGAYWNVTEFYANLIELPYRAFWTASISSRLFNSDKLGQMFDDNLTTEWEAGDVMPGDWLVIDMKTAQTFNQIILDQTKTPGDKLNGFKVYVSDDSANWGEPIAEGKGTDSKTIITMGETQIGRYIKIEATESTNSMWWKVTEFNIGLVVLDYRFGWTASISDRLFNSDKFGLMFDSDLTTNWEAGDVLPGDWLVVDMKMAQTFNQIILDQTKTPGDKLNGFKVYVSDDPANWGEPIIEGKGTDGKTKITFAEEQTGRYIKIEATESTNSMWWKITEFHIDLIELDYRFSWTATTSNSLPGGAMFDGEMTSGWSTGALQEPGQWVIINMQEPQTFNQITLGLAENRYDDYPRGYEVYVSNDPDNFGSALISGVGTKGAATVIDFLDQQAQYIKIVQTGTADESYWAIDEFDINTATDRQYRFGWTATVSDGWNSSRLPNLFDDNLETDWSSENVLTADQWMIIDMKKAQTFNLIAFDQTTNNGDYPEGFKVFVSTDGENWGTAVAESKGTNAPHTLVTFEEQTARYVKVQLTEPKGAYWAITELHVKKGDYRYGWTATVSERLSSNNLLNMFDGNFATDWSTLNVLEVGDWMIIDMKTPQTFNQIIFDQTTNNGDHPNGFKVYASNDPENFGEAVTLGGGASAPTSSAAIYADQTARYIKIELTESKGAYWAVTEFDINVVTDKDYRWGWTMIASHNNGRAMLALDGNFDTKWDSGPMYGGEWIILDMKGAMQFNQIILENSGDYPREYEVFVSNDGANWGEKVKSGLGENAQNEFGQTEIVLPEQTVRYIKINQLGLGLGASWSIFELNIDYDPTLSIEQVIEDNTQVYYSNGQIYLQGVALPNVLNIYNVLGQKLESIKVSQDIIPVDLAAGIYVITLDNNASYKLLVK